MNVFEVMKSTTEIVNKCDNRKDKIMCQYCAHQKLCAYLDKELDKTTEKQYNKEKLRKEVKKYENISI